MALNIGRVIWALGLAALPCMAAAESWDLAGHRVEIVVAGELGYRLTVDGAEILTDPLIFTDGAETLPGGAVLYGVAGSSGNACDAAPFALWLPEGAPAELSGPVETCSYLEVRPIEGGLLWESASLPGRLTERLQWTAEGGMQALEPTPFMPDAGRGWEDLQSLAGQHPAEALRLEPVYKALTEGLGEDGFQSFAERISELGSGDLTGEGYQGEACLKFTCDEDWAVVYLDSVSKQPFVIWKVSGEASYRIWPEKTDLWPPEAMAVLRDKAGQQ